MPIQPNPDRESLAARVRKLSKMTTENGCSESEANFAAAKIAAIMAEHALTQDELSIKEDASHCIKDEFIIFGATIGNWYIIQQSIARLYGCKPWQGHSRIEELGDLGISSPVRPFVFYGFANDVTACIATMGICYSAVATESEKQRKARADFGLGMLTRLAERINALRPKIQTGSALICLKDQLVTEAFAKAGIKLRTTYGSARKVDQEAFAKGFAAGANVNINGGRDSMPAATPRVLRLS